MNKRIVLTITVLLTCMLLSSCTMNKAGQEPLVVTWYIGTTDLDLFNSLEGIKKIEEATGVDIVFQGPPNNSKDAYKMMIASGNLPDVILWNYADSGFDRMYEQGTVIDLTDLIAEYAPNLSRIYQQRPEIRREVETADGKIYYFPSINPMETMEEIGRKTYNGLIIRDDWLEKLGLTCPNTIDEWYEVLSAFKNRDPNGNGLQDEIPFDGWGLHYFAPAFGVLNTFCLKPDGTVVYGPMEQEYKAYLECLNKWYMEGLLGSNCLMQSELWKTANITNDLTGSFAGLDNAWRNYLPELQEKTPQASMMAAPWLMNTEQGVRYTAREDRASHLGIEVTVITSSCKNPEAVVRLFDYMYSEEGSALLTWGVEGETYEVVDGKKHLLPEALTMEDDGFLKLYHYAIGHVQFPKYDGETVVLATYPEDQLIAERTWADASTDLVYPPAIVMSVEDNVLCDRIMTDVNNYFTEMEIRFITGEEPLSNFDTFVSNLKRMGIEEALSVYQRYYEAYKAR